MNNRRLPADKFLSTRFPSPQSLYVKSSIYVSRADISCSDIYQGTGRESMEDYMDNDIRRAFLKYIVLTVISKKSTHGYEIIKIIETCSKGKWKPSTGSIYPILDYLVSERFIQSEEIDRKKVYKITPEGSLALEEMTQKKDELLNGIAMLIDNITESDCT